MDKRIEKILTRIHANPLFDVPINLDSPSTIDNEKKIRCLHGVLLNLCTSWLDLFTNEQLSSLPHFDSQIYKLFLNLKEKSDNWLRTYLIEQNEKNKIIKNETSKTISSLNYTNVKKEESINQSSFSSKTQTPLKNIEVKNEKYSTETSKTISSPNYIRVKTEESINQSSCLSSIQTLSKNTEIKNQNYSTSHNEPPLNKQDNPQEKVNRNRSFKVSKLKFYDNLNEKDEDSDETVYNEIRNDNISPERSNNSSNEDSDVTVFNEFNLRNINRKDSIPLKTSSISSCISPPRKFSNEFNSSTYLIQNKSISELTPILEDDIIFEDNDKYIDEISNQDDIFPKTNTANPALETNKDNSKDVTNAEDKKKNAIGLFYGNVQNDGITGEFDSCNLQHSKEMFFVFRQKFGLRQFRPNQLQAINAALLRNDCFILMPTGGGKSLCYQLPALITRGITIVVSPLISLIVDQVQKLTSLDIPALHMPSNMSAKAHNQIMLELNKKEPGIKLLYLTPEKLSSSVSIFDTLKTLYQRELLSRIVIDEAHCVSHWGHDFRPDYKKLKKFRDFFPKVPIMALTATATPRVRLDVVHNLGMRNPKWFISSFNRPNLKYTILEKKGKSCFNDILILIKKEYKNKSGIIYCLSRKETEEVMEGLKKGGVLAEAYHAGQSDSWRNSVLRNWLLDKIHVVVATIAFGMGIDKPDVRFVIHYSLPKSIEGFYQESGRAGRDGLKSDCILYYSYSDMFRLRRIMDTPENKNTIKIHMDNLFRMVHFCEDKIECRRVGQLNYFGEIYDPKDCVKNSETTCDNCVQRDSFKKWDVTDISKKIIRSVEQYCRTDNLTTKQFADILKGSLNQKVQKCNLSSFSIYGLLKSWNRLDVERLLRKLVLENYIFEEISISAYQMAVMYLRPSQKGQELLSGKIKSLFLPIKSSGNNNSNSISNPLPSTSSKSTSQSSNSDSQELTKIKRECYSALMDLCLGIAQSLGASSSSIMPREALQTMSEILPEDTEQMLQIPHVTRANFVKYGQLLLDITRNYAKIYKEEKEKEEVNQCIEEFIEDDNDFEVSKDRTEIVSSYFEPSTSYQSPSFNNSRRGNFHGRGGRGFRRGAGVTGKRKATTTTSNKTKKSKTSGLGLLNRPKSS